MKQIDLKLWGSDEQVKVQSLTIIYQRIINSINYINDILTTNNHLPLDTINYSISRVNSICTSFSNVNVSCKLSNFASNELALYRYFQHLK